jgi:hypothetical protein
VTFSGNALDYNRGFNTTIELGLANIAASATNTAMTSAQGALGFLVPAGMYAVVLYLNVESSADVTAGTATFNVTVDGTIIGNTPSVELNATTNRRAGSVGRVGSHKVTAGKRIGVGVTTNSAYLPTTADHTAFVLIQLLPAS